MSETSVANKTSQGQRVTLIIIIAVVIVLLLAYAGGIVVLPLSILSNYKIKNCGSTLTLSNIYTSIYPNFIEDETLTGPVMECAVYTLAGSTESEGVWRDSYNAYQVYSQSYPNGLFVTEAHEHSAIALTGMAKDLMGEGKYSEALANLEGVLAGYSDTDASAEVVALFPEIYSVWGTDLRNTGNFDEAENIFGDFKEWAESNQNAEHAKTAQREIAQTYLNWGLELQSQKHFEEAKSKLDFAISTDPDPLSSSGSAAQAKASQVKLYTEWGDYLIEQKGFAEAMARYETTATLTESHDPIAAKDIITNGYIRWASGLTAEEDFIGALVLLDFAQENAGTDSTKEILADARSDTYLAFSESSGEQAQQAMKDAVAIVCEHHINPRLPIFGLDNDTVLAGMYGVEGTLPGEFAATTPGSLHFVACIEEEAKVIESAINSIGSFLFDPNPPYHTVKVQFNRLQYIWSVTLFEVGTGDEIDKTIIEGGDPPPLPATPYEIYNGAKSPKYFGSKPDIDDLADWLAETLK